MKSKFAPGTAPVSFSTKVEAVSGGGRSTVDSVAADGTVRHWTYTTNYDGKEVPITGDDPSGQPGGSLSPPRWPGRRYGSVSTTRDPGWFRRALPACTTMCCLPSCMKVIMPY